MRCFAPVGILMVAHLWLLAGCPSAGAAPRPNILLIMVDDMGWSDLGCYGGEVRSPHIDRLAERGLRFSTFYNCGRCCPTRASLLTGLYPHQAGVGRMTFDGGLPGYRGELSRNAVTIAEVLQEAGYRTAMVGKWHLSLTEERDDHMRQLNNQEIRPTFADIDTYPVNRGFEEHYGIIWGVINYFDPFSLVHDTVAVVDVGDDYYVTDAFSNKAVEFIDKYGSGDAPFFLYLAHCAPHWPLHALPEDIARYEGVYSAGWDAIRRRRYARQIEMGLIDAGSARLTERFPPRADWQENPTAAWDTRAMACHAAMIDRVDQGIGRIVAKLEAMGELDNTLIMLLSDNGASREEPRRPGFDRVSETRDGRPVTYYGGDQPQELLPGAEETYAGLGPEWANVCNTPFRYYKATQHEGGIRTPLVVHWPRGIAASQGGVTHQAGHVIDIMATCLDAAGADYPDAYGGHAIVPLEGQSLLPVLAGEERTPHDAIFFEHFGARAVRQGDWKLVSLPQGEWELYYAPLDQSETVNLADRQPDRVRELSSLWQVWAERSGVLPAP